MLSDDVLYILNRRLKELTGYSLGEVLAYAMNEEYIPKRKLELKNLRDKWRKVRAKRQLRENDKVIRHKKRTKYYGYGDGR